MVALEEKKQCNPRTILDVCWVDPSKFLSCCDTQITSLAETAKLIGQSSYMQNLTKTHPI